MEEIVIYLLMVQKFVNLKAKDSEIVASLLCLGKTSKDWSTDNMKKKQDLLVMFMILVQIIVLLQLMILKIFIII